MTNGDWFCSSAVNGELMDSVDEVNMIFKPIDVE